jgi:hypothetical protein
MKNVLFYLLGVFVLSSVAIAIVVPLVDYLNDRANRMCLSREPKVECIEGFAYTSKAFVSDGFAIMALAPLWDQDGKPKRCFTEKEKP